MLDSGCYGLLKPSGAGIELKLSSVQIHIHQARDLDQTDFMSAIDPYVMIFAGDHVSKGEVHTKAGNAPLFNETFEIPLAPNMEMIEIQLYDKDTCSKDDFLGRIEIPISWLNEGSWETWMNVWNKANEKAGELFIRVIPSGTFMGRSLPKMA